MLLRTFVDGAGNEWHVFEVIPWTDERRRHERRSLGEIRPEPDERRDADRRLTVGGPAATVGAQGWLCFESGEERRRLAPIPLDWRRCGETQLEVYCQSARRPKRSSVSINVEQTTDRNSEQRT